MDLAGVQGLVAAVDPRYVSWLVWQQQRCGIITAKPKFTLPDNAHKAILKVFKRLGGKFVSPGCYEVVLRENGSCSKVNDIPPAIATAPNVSIICNGSHP